jgi:hypothetical protein
MDDGTVICGECGTRNIIPANLREAHERVDALGKRLDEAVKYIGMARELLSEWQSEGWCRSASEGTTEFFASTDIAFGCEHVGCEAPFGHKHVIGGPAEAMRGTTKGET